MRPVNIGAGIVRQLVHPPISRATLSRWTRAAGVRPIFQRGNISYFKITDVARMLNIDKNEIYERLDLVK